MLYESLKLRFVNLKAKICLHICIVQVFPWYKSTIHCIFVFVHMLPFLRTRLKDHVNMSRFDTFQWKWSNEQNSTTRQPCFQSVHMNRRPCFQNVHMNNGGVQTLNWKCVHAQLEVWTCSTGTIPGTLCHLAKCGW